MLSKVDRIRGEAFGQSSVMSLVVPDTATELCGPYRHHLARRQRWLMVELLRKLEQLH